MFSVIAGSLLAAAGASAERGGAEPRAIALASWIEESVPPAAGSVSAERMLIYTIRFTNSSGSLLDGVRISSPIPAGLAYVADSHSGPANEVLFSVDGGLSFGLPSELVMVSGDGQTRAATAADYTHVRWVLDGALDVGASGFVRFKLVPR